jgi:hypothetical protein
MMTITHPYSGELKIITKKDPSEAHRALGWMRTTDFKSTTQLVVFNHTAKLFSGAILQIRMQRYDATTAYNFYYVASISYTIEATHFSLQQYKTIQSPVVCATLEKMAINRNVACAIVFGPKRLGGMILCHLHTLQGIRIIKYFTGRIANNDGVGKLMRICIEATQLEVGTFEPFMFTLHSICGPATLTASWVLDIWYLLKLFKAKITLTNSCIPLPQRQNDQSLTSLATLHTCRKGELRQINRCRIYNA